jgi:hypothetical protein
VLNQMRILGLDRRQSGTNVGRVDVGRKKLLFDVSRPLKIRLRDRFDVAMRRRGGKIFARAWIYRYLAAVFSVAVRAHRRIYDIPGCFVPTRAFADTVVEHVPAVALGLSGCHRSFCNEIVQVRRSGARQLVTDAARVLALWIRWSSCHCYARCQSSAPDIQLPWRSWPALCWNNRASLAILLMSSSGSIE